MIEPAWLTETRAAYDTVAVDYARLIPDVVEGPLDRGMLAAFAELVGPGRPVLEVGCGTGRITAHLRGLGLDVAGVDLSPGMVEVARRRYPELRFEVGSMAELAAPDGGLAGLVAWYSIIQLPPEQLAAQLAAAGLSVHATLVRQAEALDRGPQAFLLATRPADEREDAR